MSICETVTGTVQADGLNINLKLISNTFKLCARFLLYVLYLQLLRISMVIFHTEEGLYTQKVCVNLCY